MGRRSFIYPGLLEKATGSRSTILVDFLQSSFSKYNHSNCDRNCLNLNLFTQSSLSDLYPMGNNAFNQSRISFICNRNWQYFAIFNEKEKRRFYRGIVE